MDKHRWFNIADDNARSTRNTTSVSDEGVEETRPSLGQQLQKVVNFVEFLLNLLEFGVFEKRVTDRRRDPRTDVQSLL